MNKSEIYGAILNEVKTRDSIPASFALSRATLKKLGHMTEEGEKLNRENERGTYNLHNHVINDLICDYKAAGGTRDTDRFLKPDME